MTTIAIILAWVGGMLLGLHLGRRQGMREMRAEAERAGADLVVKAAISQKGEPIDFNVDPCLVDEAPVEFLIERGQTREQFAEQVRCAVDAVQAEGHTEPASAMKSFSEKIGVTITAATQLTAEESERILRERKEAYLKRAN